MQNSIEKWIPTLIDLGLSESALEGLKKYIDLLWVSNEDLNLISRKMTFEDLMENHVIDCLLPLKLFPITANHVADFGSGGGLPAVIYALQFPKVHFSLYEKSPKKQDFLKLCQKIAPNLSIHGEIPVKLAGVDLITARGFKPVDVIFDMSRDYYSQKKSYFLLKARKEKIDEELLDSQKKFKDHTVEIIPLKSPVLEVERHLVKVN